MEEEGGGRKEGWRKDGGRRKEGRRKEDGRRTGRRIRRKTNGDWKQE